MILFVSTKIYLEISYHKYRMVNEIWYIDWNDKESL